MIPYAPVQLLARDPDGRWFQIRRCPCGALVKEYVDSDCKPIAPGYAEHYEEAHAP